MKIELSSNAIITSRQQAYIESLLERLRNHWQYDILTREYEAVFTKAAASDLIDKLLVTIEEDSND